MNVLSVQIRIKPGVAKRFLRKCIVCEEVVSDVHLFASYRHKGLEASGSFFDLGVPVVIFPKHSSVHIRVSDAVDRIGPCVMQHFSDNSVVSAFSKDQVTVSQRHWNDSFGPI